MWVCACDDWRCYNLKQENNESQFLSEFFLIEFLKHKQKQKEFGQMGIQANGNQVCENSGKGKMNQTIKIGHPGEIYRTRERNCLNCVFWLPYCYYCCEIKREEKSIKKFLKINFFENFEKYPRIPSYFQTNRSGFIKTEGFHLCLYFEI